MEMKFSLRVEKCPSCKKTMMIKANRGIFPYLWLKGQATQMGESGVVYVSKSKIDDDYICIECESKGKASFKCGICSERQNSAEIQQSFGDPPEHLCKTCYETTPAKQWDQKLELLEEKHRYDFE